MSQKMAKEGPRLSKNQKFSEHFSIHCCPPFTFLNSKREIVDRKYSICKSGCFYQKKEEDWICCACQKTRPSRRRAPSPPRPKVQPVVSPSVARAPAKPRSPRPEVRSPPPKAQPRPPPKRKQQPKSSPQRGGPSRGGSPSRAPRFW
ncbi:myelin-associated oligodendrocyte basic protein isoform X1 [Suncus etruscus]|uniref:myelin-associated oligodendrocyte basic protein isoform X1 n=1 Tax=Suncus etruscus TaxID=109475 RepID=UPI00210F2846|nr:myelin-associated oligodendrocyte basic protein isoform X1 [Suncus etruscus]